MHGVEVSRDTSEMKRHLQRYAPPFLYPEGRTLYTASRREEKTRTLLRTHKHASVMVEEIIVEFTAMQAWASMPHRMACLGFPRLLSSFSTLSVSMEKRVLVCGFRSSAPKSDTVGPKPLGYCSVKIGGIPRIRDACKRGN